MRATCTANREVYVRRGERLEYFTIGYNTLEGVTSIVAGLIARSVSLVGFGLDSLIEVTSGAALLWRLHHDLDLSRREQVERAALRPRDDFADHWRALRNANILLSSAPRNSGKRSWTNCTISRR